jgi:hypothetical protein
MWALSELAVAIPSLPAPQQSLQAGVAAKVASTSLASIQQIKSRDTDMSF